LVGENPKKKQDGFVEFPPKKSKEKQEKKKNRKHPGTTRSTPKRDTKVAQRKKSNKKSQQTQGKRRYFGRKGFRTPIILGTANKPGALDDNPI